MHGVPLNVPTHITSPIPPCPQQDNTLVDIDARLADIAKKLMHAKPPEVHVELNDVGGCTVHCAGEKELSVEVSALNAQARQHLYEIADKCEKSAPVFAPMPVPGAPMPVSGIRGIVLKMLTPAQTPTPTNNPSGGIRVKLAQKLQKNQEPQEQELQEQELQEPHQHRVAAQKLKHLINTTKTKEILGSSEIMPAIVSYLKLSGQGAARQISTATCNSLSRVPFRADGAEINRRAAVLMGLSPQDNARVLSFYGSPFQLMISKHNNEDSDTLLQYWIQTENSAAILALANHSGSLFSQTDNPGGCAKKIAQDIVKAESKLRASKEISGELGDAIRKLRSRADLSTAGGNEQTRQARIAQERQARIAQEIQEVIQQEEAMRERIETMGLDPMIIDSMRQFLQSQETTDDCLIRDGSTGTFSEPVNHSVGTSNYPRL